MVSNYFPLTLRGPACDARPWITPDVAAPLTVDAYKAGRDPALEAIARFVLQPSLTDRLRPPE